LEIFQISKLIVEVLEGDITNVEADAIVNAANRYLKHGGGVAGAIVRRGGIEIQRESDKYVKKYGPVPVGCVAVTGAGKLKAKYVIHAVGPRYGEKNGDSKLAMAIRNAVLKADKLGLKSLALPAISTGIYGYPLEKCADIMAETFREVAEELNSLNRIIVVLYGGKAYEIFVKSFTKLLK